MRSSWLILIVLAVSPSISLGEESQPTGTQEVSAGEISLWVSELDSELFDTRERAQKHLTKAGEAALEAVSQLAQNGSLESSTRALNIMLAWSEAEDPKLVVAALEQLASLGNRPKEAILARELLAEVRENVALEEIVKLGGSFRLGVQINGVISMRPERSVQVVIGVNWKGGLEGLDHLEQVPHAVLVCFHSPPLADEALPILERLPRLKRVELYGTTMSPQAIEELRTKLTAATIEVRSGAFLGVHGTTFANQAHVAKVEPGSAAEKAGIKDNDIITKLNAEEVKDFLTLTGLIAQHQPGDSVTLTVQRPRPNDLPETLDLKVTFAQWGIDGAGGVAPRDANQLRNSIPDNEPDKFRLDRR